MAPQALQLQHTKETSHLYKSYHYNTENTQLGIDGQEKHISLSWKPLVPWSL